MSEQKQEWCEHLKQSHSEITEGYYWDNGNLSTDTKYCTATFFKFCPICGTPRPEPKEEYEVTLPFPHNHKWEPMTETAKRCVLCDAYNWKPKPEPEKLVRTTCPHCGFWHECKPKQPSAVEELAEEIEKADTHPFEGNGIARKSYYENLAKSAIKFFLENLPKLDEDDTSKVLDYHYGFSDCLDETKKRIGE